MAADVRGGAGGRKMPIGKRFQKGQSGNPGGRPAVSGPLKELAKAHTDEALATLVAALKADENNVRVMAANSLLDRGWGKPTQHHELDAGDELVRRMGEAAKRLKDGGG